MHRIPSPAGVTGSYEKYGSGPPLVLVRGGFSDHKTNWEFVKPLFEKQFTVYAIARRWTSCAWVGAICSESSEALQAAKPIHNVYG